MTWTYDETDLNEDDINGRKNIVRLLIGDNNSTDELMQDEEIEFYITQNTNDVYAAAVDAAESIVSKYAREVNRQVGDLAIEAENKMIHYVGVVERLKSQQRRAKPRARIFVGNDKDQRLFFVGMHDNSSGEYRSANDTEDDVVGNY